MPILRLKEIRDLSAEDRLGRLKEWRTELLRLRTMIKAGGTIENPARIRQLRMTIAQILTVEHEQELGIGKAKPEAKKPKAPKPRSPKRREALHHAPGDNGPIVPGSNESR